MLIITFMRSNKKISRKIIKTGIDIFIDPPDKLLIKKKGINAVKTIQSLR